MSLTWYQDAKRSEIGAHLSAPGSYQAAIVSLFAKYPNLRNRDWKVPKGYECEIYTGKLVLLELQEKQNAQATCFRDLDHVRGWFRDQPALHSRNRLYLMDCMPPNTVSVIGEHFGINPTVFMRQQRTALWEFGHDRGNTPSLPSSQGPCKSFTMEYCELRWISTPIRGPSLRCRENSRHINVSRNNGAFDQTGIVHRKATFWSRRNAAGGWDVLLMLDPPCERALAGRADSAKPMELPSQPYQGGYQDFIQYRDISEAQQTHGPPRTSMLEDLCYYWTHHGSLIDDLSNPAISQVFLLKIIASHYVLLTEYLNGLANELSFKLSRTFEDMDIPSLESDWNDLQSWIPRATEYIDRVEDINTYLAVHNDALNQPWTDTKPDFKLIHHNLVKIKGRCEGFVTSFMGLASIVGNRQSLEEAKSVHILTVLGTFFIPLSFSAGLFSMSSTYIPGSPGFIIYLAVALPLAAVVSTVAFLYDVRVKWFNKKGRTVNFLKFKS